MRTPIETIADSLINFILSLLRDPAAVEQFSAQPQAVLADNGLEGACGADVRAVAPVVVESPAVVPRVPVNPPEPPSDNVVTEIQRIINQFTTIDNRATIIDQSTNQNIWTEGGDVTQVFDQSAVTASGDGAIAAGDDADVDNSTTDITTGDVSIGNTTGSNNTTVDADVTGADTVTVDAGGEDPVLVTEPAAEPEPVPVVEPVPEDTAADAPGTADGSLLSDMTASDTFDTSDALPPAPDAYTEDPMEED